MDKQRICIIGTGNFATALGNRLVQNTANHVVLLSIEEKIVKSINEQHENSHYFPNVKLSERLTASLNKDVLTKSDFIFLAIPSFVVVDYVIENIKLINKKALLINLAKGFSKDRKKTIGEALENNVSNPVCTLKGPTFAREVINNIPTAMTLGVKDKVMYKNILKIFESTGFYIDYSADMVAVELLSILKNIYAIVIGIVDAHFNSPNIRFFILNKAFNEMRSILKDNQLDEETIFRYCGYGDFALTALNDLSRNRTLGLLIGKGFFTEAISNRVLLEGQIAVKVFCEDRYSLDRVERDYPIIAELYKVFKNPDYELSDFIWKIA
ncbi:MAG: NAD(P)H-dependent glycerol-3-phosphate dehydrogenase [Bacteroidota bacterium]